MGGQLIQEGAEALFFFTLSFRNFISMAVRLFYFPLLQVHYQSSAQVFLLSFILEQMAKWRLEVLTLHLPLMEPRIRGEVMAHFPEVQCPIEENFIFLHHHLE